MHVNYRANPMQECYKIALYTHNYSLMNILTSQTNWTYRKTAMLQHCMLENGVDLRK